MCSYQPILIIGRYISIFPIYIYIYLLRIHIILSNTESGGPPSHVCSSSRWSSFRHEHSVSAGTPLKRFQMLMPLANPDKAYRFPSALNKIEQTALGRRYKQITRALGYTLYLALGLCVCACVCVCVCVWERVCECVKAGETHAHTHLTWSESVPMRQTNSNLTPSQYEICVPLFCSTNTEALLMNLHTEHLCVTYKRLPKSQEDIVH